jgi:predicted PurR-regulated permease PerM
MGGGLRGGCGGLAMAKDRRSIVLWALAAALLVLFALRFTAIIQAFFMTFLATLFAIFLYGSGRRLSELIGWHKKAWIIIILVVASSGLVTAAIFSGDAIARQLHELGTQVRPALDRAAAYLSQFWWGWQIVSAVEGFEISKLFPQIRDFVGVIVSSAVGVVVVIVGGVFMAMEPERYRKGLMWLSPEGKEKEFLENIEHMGDLLYRWTIGRLASMAAVAVLTLIGLLIVGSPLAILLALFAGLLSFIPNFGPLSSAIVAALVGLSVSPLLAAWIILIFIVVQVIEGNLITPLIQRRAVHVPAGLIIIVQALMGLSFGLLGLLVATPLMVAVIALVKGVRPAPASV